MQDRSTRDVAVVHFGNDAAASGSGISSVIAGQIGRNLAGVTQRAVTTYDPGASSPLARSLPTVRAVAHALSRNRVPTIYHIHLSQRASFVREGMIALVGALRGVPIVATLHGSGLLSESRYSAVMLRIMARWVGDWHVLSQAHADRFVESTGRRCVVIPNSVSVRPGKPILQRQARVVFGGEVGERKGADILLRAWRQIRKGAWTLHLYGPVAEGFATTLSHELLGQQGVEVAGAVARDELLEVMQDSRIAVLPSRAEALPMFVLEAMASGCAVVASNAGALPQVLGGGAGVLVPCGDYDALAVALERLIQSPEDLEALALTGLAKVTASYDADVIDARWVELYCKVLGRRGDGLERRRRRSARS